MTRTGRLALSGIGLAVLLLLMLTGCGTIEIRLEQPGSPRPVASPVAEVLATERASGYSMEMTPTPTPLTYDPWVPEPAFTPVPVGEYPAPAGLRVAFVRDGQLWQWTTGETDAVPLSTIGDNFNELRFSDDGEMLAFQWGEDLWGIHSDGTGQRILVSAEDFASMEPADQELALHRFEWVPGTHLLAFNTRLRMAFGTVLNHDLHLVDGDTLEQRLLLPPGEGGEFYYSPDGRQIALVTPGKITLVEADGGNRREGILLHTPVATHSEYEYYAQPVWAADGSSLLVAIPPADPLAQPNQQTTIWHLPTDGTPARLQAGIEAAPLLGPDAISFSPDLKFVAYAQLRGDVSGAPEQLESWLEVRRLANNDTQAYPEVNSQYGWSPDSRHFAFSAGRQVAQLKIGQWSDSTLSGSVEAGTPVYDVRWVDAGHYLFVARHGTERGAEGDRWELRLGDLHGSGTVLASADDWPRYDFALVSHLAQVAVPTPTPMPRATARQEPRPTATPIAPLPGLVYRREDGLWTDTGWELVQLSDRANASLSSDGTQALYLNEDGDDVDLWLADWLRGERRNLTRTPERIEADPHWWPERPDVVLFGSRPQGAPVGMGASGFLTVVDLTGDGYRVLDDQHQMGGQPAPSPDGTTIAYGRGPTAWLYRWDVGPEAFDPVDYGLAGAGEIEIGNPAWSPDGTKLAWVLGGDLAGEGDFRWGLAVFDLESQRVQEMHSLAPAWGDDWPPAASWSRDGAWLAYETWTESPDESEVWAVRADGMAGKVTYLAGGHPAGWSPGWSPDGQWLAFSGTSQGEPAHWLATVGTWSLHALDLPPAAQIVDWIIWRR
jgi:hypothetical protein